MGSKVSFILGSVGDEMADILTNSIALIREFAPLALQSEPRGYCVCSSKGKDSIVLEKLFEISDVKYWIKYNITGIDPPELVYFAREQFKMQENKGVKIKIQMYEKSMYQMIIDHKTPPTRLMRYCCAELKERIISSEKTSFHSFGVRKAESTNRSTRNEAEILHKNKDKRVSLPITEENSTISLDSAENVILANDNTENRRIFENCAAKGIRAVNPLIYWTDSQIWDFIKSEKLDYCTLYDDGFKRLGCIGCPMAGKQRFYEFKRYPKFRDYYLKAFERMLIKRKQDGVDERRISQGKTLMLWQTANDVMDWWLEKDVDKMQISLFD